MTYIDIALPDSPLRIPVFWAGESDEVSVENVPGGSYDVDEDFVKTVGDESQMDQDEEEN
jgi:hypothetical protein